MGMFDYIKCEMDLPNTPIKPTCDVFQTKDTPDQNLTEYTIKKDGTLWWKPYKMVKTPIEKKPYPDAKPDSLEYLIGYNMREEKEEEQIVFNGNILFYEFDENENWWQYQAKFINGNCDEIELIEYEPRDELTTNPY